jgi:hypothetical protein
MAAPALDAIVQRLRATGFQDLAGAGASFTIPISERLINEFIRASLPDDARVREVLIQVDGASGLAVRVRPRASLLPPLTVRLVIERQPDFPGHPVLALRITTLPGLFSLAGAALPLAEMLPPGVRLQREMIFVDLAAVAAHQGLADLVRFVRQLRVTTEDRTLLLRIEAGVD